MIKSEDVRYRFIRKVPSKVVLKLVRIRRVVVVEAP